MQPAQIRFLDWQRRDYSTVTRRKREGFLRFLCATIWRVMAVNPELLKILVCPLCKTPVVLIESGQGLKCSQCHRVYPIRDDIPVMLISEAKVED
jgi:uncharacterized protein YbaR (Trm112 family)